jgi:sirohydrochlorin cobaltochelatase
LRGLDKNVFVGTVEDNLNLETVLGELKANSLRKAWIVPLMTVAGDHALNDLFGKESWKQTFIANGIQAETVTRGLGENPALAEQWVDGLKNAQKH